MTEPTDEMRDVFLATQLFELGRGASEAHAVRRALTAVLAIAARQHQQELHDAFQRGWQRGQHRLCPRCGVELEREVAAERDQPLPLSVGRIQSYCGRLERPHTGHVWVSQSGRWCPGDEDRT